MEVLEIDEGGECFPSWIVIPLTTKVGSFKLYSNLPSIPELRVGSVFHWERISGRCPALKSLLIDGIDSSALGKTRRLLEARRDQVKAGTLFDGIKMELLERLVIRPGQFSPQYLDCFRELVDTVVNRQSEPEFWEVQI